MAGAEAVERMGVGTGPGPAGRIGIAAREAGEPAAGSTLSRSAGQMEETGEGFGILNGSLHAVYPIGFYPVIQACRPVRGNRGIHGVGPKRCFRGCVSVRRSPRDHQGRSSEKFERAVAALGARRGVQLSVADVTQESEIQAALEAGHVVAPITIAVANTGTGVPNWAV